MNPLPKCHLACGSTEASQTGTDSTRNAAKLKEGQTYESSSAHAVSFAYRRAF